MDTTIAYKCNDSCPLKHKGCEESTTESIAIVQKWSDEHPEKPTITKEEKAFLDAFRIPYSKQIKRAMGLWIQFDDTGMELHRSMFPFIEEGQAWTVGDLLELEVKDD